MITFCQHLLEGSEQSDPSKDSLLCLVLTWFHANKRSYKYILLKLHRYTLSHQIFFSSLIILSDFVFLLDICIC